MCAHARAPVLLKRVTILTEMRRQCADYISEGRRRTDLDRSSVSPATSRTPLALVSQLFELLPKKGENTKHCHPIPFCQGWSWARYGRQVLRDSPVVLRSSRNHSFEQCILSNDQKLSTSSSVFTTKSGKSETAKWREEQEPEATVLSLPRSLVWVGAHSFRHSLSICKRQLPRGYVRQRTGEGACLTSSKPTSQKSFFA